MSNGKVLIIHLIVGLTKRIWWDSNALQYIKMSKFFPKPYEPFGGDINVTVDLSNYATKTDFKNVTHVDTSNFVLKKKFS